MPMTQQFDTPDHMWAFYQHVENTYRLTACMNVPRRAAVEILSGADLAMHWDAIADAAARVRSLTPAQLEQFDPNQHPVTYVRTLDELDAFASVLLTRDELAGT